MNFNFKGSKMAGFKIIHKDITVKYKMPGNYFFHGAMIKKILNAQN